MASSSLRDQVGGSRPVVSYFYQEDIGHFYYGPGHPMKPHRVKLTHHLLLAYGLYPKMRIFRPPLPSESDLTRFHSSDYVNFLRSITPESEEHFARQAVRHNLGPDCPAFDGLYDYCRLYTSGSISGAVQINRQRSDVVINWAGGMHHAKKSEASGFCYVNDIVLGILELLKHHQRVLYIDIDIHHGDGVEEAFYSTNRVLTLSFHKHGEFFPGTGAVRDCGHKHGKGFSINFPLDDGMDDATYERIYNPVLDAVMARFQPGAVVMCCGADSIAGDRLGCFNLSIKRHAACIRYVRSFGVPVMLLGGGGYTPRNVARCWAYETAVALGDGTAEAVDNAIPFNDFFEYYAPRYELHLPVDSGMENRNKKEDLGRKLSDILQIINSTEAMPGAQIRTGQPGTTQVPQDASDPSDRADLDAIDPETRVTGMMEGRRAHPLEAEPEGIANGKAASAAARRAAAESWIAAPEGEEDIPGL